MALASSAAASAAVAPVTAVADNPNGSVAWQLLQNSPSTPCVGVGMDGTLAAHPQPMVLGISVSLFGDISGDGDGSGGSISCII